VRKVVLYGLLSLTAVLIRPMEAFSANWEIHPGLYTAYEYSDNYRGVAENTQSESTYRVGPGLGLLCTGQRFRWELNGHISKEYHNRYEEDEGTEGMIATRATATGEMQSVDLAYEYLETQSREQLDQARGIRRIHAGTLTYHRTFEQASELSLAYAKGMEYAPAPDEDVGSDRGSLEIGYQVTPHNHLGLAGGYTYYKYEQREDVAVTNEDVAVTDARLNWRYALTRRLGTGIILGYAKNAPRRSPYQDIYTTSAFLDYALTQYTSLSASAGHSWLHSENHENHEISDAEFSLTRQTQDDTIDLNFSWGYAYEYTSGSTYGIYKTMAAGISWEHTLTPTLNTSVSSALTQREPTTEMVTGAKEKDITHRLAIRYRPWAYLDMLASYTHLQHDSEISDTISENRYGITVEVRYWQSRNGR